MEVVRRTGATYRQLDYWTGRGYVAPAQAQTQGGVPRPADESAQPGTGHVRLWDDTEIAVIGVMVALTRWGLAPRAAARAARRIVVDGTVEVAPGVALTRTS